MHCRPYIHHKILQHSPARKIHKISGPDGPPLPHNFPITIFHNLRYNKSVTAGPELQDRLAFLKGGCAGETRAELPGAASVTPEKNCYSL
jgi:hypothetical protein